MKLGITWSAVHSSALSVAPFANGISSCTGSEAGSAVLCGEHVRPDREGEIRVYFSFLLLKDGRSEQGVLFSFIFRITS